MTGTLVFIIRILLAIALYAFIAVLFVTIWRQLRAQMKVLSPELSTQIQLNYKDNPDQDGFTIQQAEVFIGRDPNCKVHIADETVSSQHARIFLSEHNWWVHDLKSTNGTWLNEEKIEQPCILAENDIIRVGKIRLAVHISKPFGN